MELDSFRKNTFQEAEPTQRNLDIERELRIFLDEQLKREEDLWRQKSRVSWLTSILSQSQSGRKEVGEELLQFYHNLFTSSHPNIPNDLENLIEAQIVEDNDMLSRIPDVEEITMMLALMNPHKAPSPDRMTMLFFKHYWDSRLKNSAILHCGHDNIYVYLEVKGDWD